MDVLTRFIIEISIALLVSSATTFVITTVLKNLLIDLFGDVVHADGQYDDDDREREPRVLGLGTAMSTAQTGSVFISNFI